MPTDPQFRMTVGDVFSIKGRGTVATGKIESGSLKVGDEVEIVRASGGPKKAVVAGVEMFHKVLPQVKAGDNVGVLLKDIGKNDLQHGDVLTGSADASAAGWDFTWKP